jgi:hypothetical protein
MLGRMVALQRTFLVAVGFEDRGIQIQAVAFAADWHAIHLPLRPWFEQSLHVAHREAPEQIADRVVGGNRSMPNNAWSARSPRSQLVCAKRFAPTRTAIRKAVNVTVGSI